MVVDSLKPYWYLARWHRPVGSLLLMFPCWWGVAYFPWQETSLSILALCALGAFLMRGAGCTLNDWFDQDYDRQVERCKTRPIAANALTMDQVYGFIVFQLMFGGLILWFFPYRAWPFAFLGAVLKVIYPLSKRITNYPQVVLGLTFNMGLWVGAVAITPNYVEELLPLSLIYLAGVFWTVGYDTIYALQDKDDDLLIGIGSTTIAFGKYVKPITLGVYALAFASLVLSGILSGRSMAYYALLTVAFGIIKWRLICLDIIHRLACDQFFKDNIWLGLAIFLALAVSRL